jgi:hypothetical protein
MFRFKLSDASDRTVALGTLVLVFGIAWIWHLTSVALSAPMDSIEQLVWSHSVQWGYYKHPPLPTWVLIPFVRVWGMHELVPTVLGAVVTLASVGVFHALLQRIWGRQQAWLGVLLALCITFYNGRLNYYNHNILLMLAVSLSVYFLWRIIEDGRTRWWVGLGVAAGLGMLSKYQYVVVLAPSLYGLYLAKPWRSRAGLLNLALALAITMLMVAPHLVWLLSGDVQANPIHYALKSSRPDFMQAQPGPPISRLHSGVWLLDLVFNRCLPALVLLVLAWPLSKRQANGPAVVPADVRGRHFLLAWSILPPLTITLLGLVLGMDLQMQWGTAFALWMVPGFMCLLGLDRCQLTARSAWAVLLAFAAIQGLLMLHSYQTSAFGCCTVQNRWRTFESQAIARELEQAAREPAGGQLRILVGPMPAAGAIALALQDKPRVLIDGNPAISPWIERAELRLPGVVEVFPPQHSPADARRLPSGWGWRMHVPAD